jgi:putative membrane protein
MSDYYEWFKAAHVISVISWMAGMFYLPRLYVYHTKVEYGSESDKIFQEMERKLLRIIINPAMISTFVFGILLAYIYGIKALGKWFHIKMTAVLFLTMYHGMLAVWRKDFVRGANKHSEKFYRVMNEVPVILMIISVVMVVLKPFE